MDSPTTATTTSAAAATTAVDMQPSTDDILHYDKRRHFTILTVGGSRDNAEAWQKGNVNDGLLTTDHSIRGVRYICHGRNNSNNNHDGAAASSGGSATNLILMADSTKVSFLGGMAKDWGKRIRRLTLSSTLSAACSDSNDVRFDDRDYEPEGKRMKPTTASRQQHDSSYPLLLSSRDQADMPWTMPWADCSLQMDAAAAVEAMHEIKWWRDTHADPQQTLVADNMIHNIWSSTLLLSASLWNCPELTELVLDLSTNSNSRSDVPLIAPHLSNNDSSSVSEEWKAVTLTLREHKKLQVVRIRIYPTSSTATTGTTDAASSPSFLLHEDEWRGDDIDAHQEQEGGGRTAEQQQEEEEASVLDFDKEEAELVALAAPSPPSPMDIFVTLGIVKLERLTVFEHTGHGGGDGQGAAASSTVLGKGCCAGQLKASSLVELMHVPTLRFLRYTNLGFSTSFETAVTNAMMECDSGGSDGAAHVTQWRNSRLQEMDLSGNRLTDRDATAIAQRLKGCLTLSKLNMMDNPAICHQGFTAINTVVQDIQQQKHAAAVEQGVQAKQMVLLLCNSSFSLWPSDDNDGDADDCDAMLPRGNSQPSPTSVLVPPVPPFSPIGGVHYGLCKQQQQQEPETPLACTTERFTTMNDSPTTGRNTTSAFAPFFGSNNNRSSSNADDNMMMD